MAEEQKIDRLKVAEELEALRNGNGVYVAETVLEYAEHHPQSELHKCFTWDDSAAAREHRLNEARKVIRVYVELQPHPMSQQPIRAFVSLKSDRTQPGGGYRKMTDVLSSRDLREQLVLQALGEMNRAGNRYRHLQELAAVFAEMDAAQAAAEKPAKKTRRRRA